VPYNVEKDESACSSSKPWAVKGPGGKVFGCHASKADAEKQQAALYANTDAAARLSAAAMELEHVHMERVRSLSAPIKLAVPETTYTNDGVVLCRMRDVPLMEVGMQFPASTGPVDFGFTHLSAAVKAGSDPVVPRRRLKLGHTDPRYNEMVCPCCSVKVKFDFNDSYMFDGDPNFGFVENMRLDNQGALITADLVDVPYWLASIAPVAFPSRSIEGWFGYTGPNQREYDFVVTDLALLGVLFPGVMSLADLPKMYGSEMPDFVEVIA
jgi:hypothetical protein